MSAAWVGLAMAMPPILAGKAKSSCYISFGDGLPVSAGTSLVLMIVSTGNRFAPMQGIVRVRQAHLQVIP